MSAPAIPRTLVRAVGHGTKDSPAAFYRSGRAGASYRRSSERSSGRHGSSARRADPWPMTHPVNKPAVSPSSSRRPSGVRAGCSRQALCWPNDAIGPVTRLESSREPPTRESLAGTILRRPSIDHLLGGPIFWPFLSDQTSRWLSNDLLVAICLDTSVVRSSVCAAQKILDSSRVESGIPARGGGWR